MNIFWNIQNKLKHSNFAVLSIVLLNVYFGFYAINGERGLFKMFYLKKEIAAAKEKAEIYQKQKNDLESKVRLLSSDSLDLDLLDERARIVLNLSSEDDFVILDK